MALATSQLGFVGAVPVDRNTVERTLVSEFITASSAANTDIEIPLFWADSRNPVITIKQAYFTPMTDTTKNTSDYITVKIVNRKGDASGTDILATFNTNASSGTVSKYVRQAFTVDYTKVISPGDLITFVSTNTGSGKITPVGKVELLLQQ